VGVEQHSAKSLFVPLRPRLEALRWVGQGPMAHGEICSVDGLPSARTHSIGVIHYDLRIP
jgi:hypothetical protein